MSRKRSPQERAWQIEKLLENLTTEETTKLNKFYPFREDRDETICKLKTRGVSYDLLEAITGLQASQLKRIVKEGRAHK